MGKKISTLFKKPLVIALLASVISFLLWSLLLDKNKGNIIDNGRYTRGLYLYYKDIDNDSLKEKVIFQDYSDLGKPMVQILNTRSNKYLGIWNLKGTFIKFSPLLFGDFNNDQIKETHAFTRNKDSIFIYTINTQKDGRYFIDRMFVTKTHFYQGKVDVRIKPIGEDDMNGDGFKELYFAVDAGFSMEPRAIFGLDIKNKNLFSSPKAGVRFTNAGFQMSDINQDGKKEIIASTHGSDNYPDTSKYPYNDQSSWLMVFDNKLNFLFDPIEFKGAPSYLIAHPYHKNNKTYLTALFNNMDKHKKNGIELYLFNTKGMLLRNKNLLELPGIDSSTFFNLSVNRDNWKDLFLISRNGYMFLLNENLQVEKIKDLGVREAGFYNYAEIDESKKGKEILISTSEGFLIFDNNFNKIVSVEADRNCLGYYNVTSYKRNHRTIIYAQSGIEWFIIAYQMNWLFKYRWLLSLLIGLFIFSLLFIRKAYLKAIRTKAINKKLRLQEAEKKRLAKELHDELGSKLTGLRLQIENMKENDKKDSLNEITDYIQDTHKEIRNIIQNLTPPKFKEYNFFEIIFDLINEYNKYSHVSIDFEVFPNKGWNGDISEQMKYQTYRILQEAINNIIKHAEADHALIQLTKIKNKFIVYIEDNGKGFQKELLDSPTKGLGLENIKLRTNLLNGKFNIRTDKQGTIIEIEFPLK